MTAALSRHAQHVHNSGRNLGTAASLRGFRGRYRPRPAASLKCEQEGLHVDAGKRPLEEQPTDS